MILFEIFVTDNLQNSSSLISLPKALRNLEENELVIYIKENDIDPDALINLYERAVENEDSSLREAIALSFLAA